MKFEKALIFACRVYKGERNKGGEPYILHPLRVMLQMDTSEEKIIALLHDVLELTDCLPEELYDYGFSKRVVKGVECLTKTKDMTYEEYIDRVASCKEDIIQIKLADLKDNMEMLNKSGNLSEKDIKRMEKYINAYNKLESVIIKDIPEEVEAEAVDEEEDDKIFDDNQAEESPEEF